jgi:hypothetical protein
MGPRACVASRLPHVKPDTPQPCALRPPPPSQPWWLQVHVRQGPAHRQGGAPAAGGGLLGAARPPRGVVTVLSAVRRPNRPPRLSRTSQATHTPAPLPRGALAHAAQCYHVQGGADAPPSAPDGRGAQCLLLHIIHSGITPRLRVSRGPPGPRSTPRGQREPQRSRPLARHRRRRRRTSAGAAAPPGDAGSRKHRTAALGRRITLCLPSPLSLPLHAGGAGAGGRATARRQHRRASIRLRKGPRRA